MPTETLVQTCLFSTIVDIPLEGVLTGVEILVFSYFIVVIYDI